MTTFISFVDINNTKVYINPDNISFIVPVDNKCYEKSGVAIGIGTVRFVIKAGEEARKILNQLQINGD